MRISKKVAEIWLKLFKKIEIYATMLDNNVKYNYRKAVTQYMNRFELVVPCHFGLEAVVKREIYDLGYEITRVEDGRVSFEGDAEAICRANIFLRGAERVLLQVGRFKAAIMAASIGNVPLPQNGSTSILSACHGVSMMSDAASVSVSGALLVARRYPLL